MRPRRGRTVVVPVAVHEDDDALRLAIGGRVIQTPLRIFRMENYVSFKLYISYRN